MPTIRTMTNAKAYLLVLAVLAVILFAGCATYQPQRTFSKDGATQGDLDRDIARCQYEAVAATQNTAPGLRTIIGQEIERARRQSDLIVLCLTANGWRQS